MAKKKRKPTKAELEAEQHFAKMMAKWDKVPKFARSSKVQRVIDKLELSDSYRAPPGRETPHFPSRNTGEVAAVKQTTSVYTGTAIVGIATLHKSISQPVFSQEEATDVARMRRN